MLGASFYTLTYWVAFGAICVYLIFKVVETVERRKQVRRMRERRLRRQHLDQLEPKRWLP